MKRFLPLFVVLMCGLFFTKPAGAVEYDCTQYPGLADHDGDRFCVFVGNASRTTSGWNGKIDCNDDNPSVNPAAREIVDDGVDQDCLDDDLKFPTWLTQAAVGRYRSHYSSWDEVRFIEEYRRCRAAPTRCVPNDSEGIFVVVNPEVDLFADAYEGRTNILGCDGVREVVTKVQESHNPEDCSAGSGGGSSSGSTTTRSSVSSGPSRTTLLERGLGEERTAREAADTAFNDRLGAIDDRLGGIDQGNTVRDEVINGLIATDKTLTQAIAREETERKEADDEIRRIAEGAAADAGAAVETANGAAAQSGLIEVSGVGGVLGHLGLDEYDQFGNPTGETIRGSAIGGGGFEIRAGVDGYRFEVAAFGQVLFGSDGFGTGTDLSFLLGADTLFEIGDSRFSLGPWVAYLQTEDHANLIDLSVIERGCLGGLTASYDLVPGLVRGSIFARAGIGGGQYGLKAAAQDNAVAIIPGPTHLFLFQVGLRWGVGARR